MAVEVMDLTTVSQSLPELETPQISRDNLLDTIDTIFAGDAGIVVVEGKDHIGKTSLLAQFARRHPLNTFSLFTKVTSRFWYDPELLQRDLCNQLQWILKRQELLDTEEVDDTFLRLRIFELQKRARKLNQVFYFVIDGLHSIPADDRHIRELVQDMLPFGGSYFRFLLTGGPGQPPISGPKAPTYKSFPLPGFTLDETLRYFADICQDRESLEDIHKLWKGVPGYLAIIRRILKAGTPVDTLVADMPNQLRDLFEFEWRTIDEENDLQATLLAIIVHDPKSHTVGDLARLLSVDAQTIHKLLDSLSFISINSNTEEVDFASHGFREFAMSKLSSYKEKVNRLLVDDLLKEPESDSALIHLPSYLEQAGRLDDVLDYLSPQRIALMVQHSQSLSRVRATAHLGVTAAYRLHKDADLVRFSMQASILAELNGAEMWQSEVRARMAVNDYTAALALAHNNVLKEDRLHLLAIIAKSKREQNLAPEPELVEQIRQLYDQIDIDSLGEHAIDIASDLIYSLPDLAIELVERATIATPDKPTDALDWAFARLSSTAGKRSSEALRTELTDTTTKIQSRIKDPAAIRFSIAASRLYDKYSAQEIRQEVKKLPEVSDRIYLLRKWCIANPERDDATMVVDHAIKLVIQTTSYAPNAMVLRELATPLPYVKDGDQLKQLVGIFEGQKATVAKLGPTEDYVKLELILARAEMGYDLTAARNRVIDTYYYITEITDLSLRCGCLAHLLSSLWHMDPHRELEAPDRIHTSAEAELLSAIDQLLNVASNQFEATETAIRALVEVNLDLALSIAMRLNTEHYRDEALEAIIEAGTESPTTTAIGLTPLQNVLHQFTNTPLKDVAISTLVENLSRASIRNDLSLHELTELLEQIRDIGDAYQRCKTYCDIYILLSRQHESSVSNLPSECLRELYTSWIAIDAEWNRINAGFNIAGTLAEYSLETAQDYLAMTEQFRRETMLDAQTTAMTYVLSLQLVLRTYTALLSNSLDRDGDLEAIGKLISQTSSYVFRMQTWAQLAIRFYTNGRPEQCQIIVNQHVKPLLVGIRSEDDVFHGLIGTTVAASLYCANKTSAFEYIGKLPGWARDLAYAGIAQFIITGQPPMEPYHLEPGEVVNLNYGELIALCDLLDMIQSDGMITALISTIVDTMTHRQHRYSYSGQQKEEIIRRLNLIVTTRLPTKGGVQHDGYKMIAQAEIARLQKANHSRWVELINAAKNVPNLMDKATTLGKIASNIPSSDQQLRRTTFREAKELVDSIPLDLERLSAYQMLAEISDVEDPSFRKACIETALDLSVHLDSPNSREHQYEHQRKLVDIAYSIDPNYAASLASLADDDPARARTNAQLQTHLRKLEQTKQIANKLSNRRSDRRDAPVTIDQSILPTVAATLLAGLNSGRIEALPLDKIRDYIQTASQLEFHESYLVLAWAIENIRRRPGAATTAKSTLRLLHEATLTNTELCTQILRPRQAYDHMNSHHYDPDTSEAIVLRPNDREAALQILKDWLTTTLDGYLKICDPDFGLEDMELLQLVLSITPSCRISILTSRRQQSDTNVQVPWDESYRKLWREYLLDQEPHSANVVIAGTESGGYLPIEDRWWLTNNGGIRFTVPFRKLGSDVASSISYLSAAEAETREKQVDQLLQLSRREYDGERLLYTLFTL